MNENVIEIKDVSMCFNMSKDKIISLKEYFIKLIKKQLFFEGFWALRDISLEIKKGEVFGIVGFNGAGKSTLLKVIAGVLKPTKGTASIKGAIAPLIELGAGFDMDLTASENIFLNGSILGYTPEFMKDKFEEIVNFSELHEFMDVALKNFSSGMVARLGFAIATVTKPDILIVDEILSVGDFHFQEKCENRITNMINNGTTVILVSHSLEQVEKMCNRVAWIEKGRIKRIGNADVVCQAFKTS